MVRITKRYGMVYIYGLRDPETKRWFYIGRSQRPKGRLIEHMTEAQRYQNESQSVLERLFGVTLAEDAVAPEDTHLQETGWGDLDISPLSTKHVTRKKTGRGKGTNPKKLKWIISLWARGLEPEFEILDQWDAPTQQDANRLEDAWVACMRAKKQPLTNVFYSHRMSPSWYGTSNRYYKVGWPLTPEEYIQRLKVGTVAAIADEGDDATERAGVQFSPAHRRRLAKRAAAQSKTVKSKASSKKRR